MISSVYIGSLITNFKINSVLGALPDLMTYVLFSEQWWKCICINLPNEDFVQYFLGVVRSKFVKLNAECQMMQKLLLSYALHKEFGLNKLFYRVH